MNSNGAALIHPHSGDTARWSDWVNLVHHSTAERTVVNRRYFDPCTFEDVHAAMATAMTIQMPDADVMTFIRDGWGNSAASKRFDCIAGSVVSTRI